MGIADNCNPGQTSYNKTIGMPKKQRKAALFLGEGGCWEGLFEGKSAGEKQEFRVMKLFAD